MSITTTAIGSATGNGPTVSITVGAGGVPAGVAIYLHVFEYSNAVAVSANGSVADNGSTPNTYAGLTGGLATPNTNWLEIYQAFNAHPLSSGNTITYTLFNSGNAAAISAYYATGVLSTGNPYDSATVHTATFTHAQPSTNTSGTPSVSGELFLAAAGWDNTANVNPGFTLDTGNGWSGPPPTSASGSAGGAEYGVGGGTQVNASTGTLVTRPTFSGSITLVTGGTIVLGLKPAPLPTLHPYAPLRVYLRR